MCDNVEKRVKTAREFGQEHSKIAKGGKRMPAEDMHCARRFIERSLLRNVRLASNHSMNAWLPLDSVLAELPLRHRPPQAHADLGESGATMKSATTTEAPRTESSPVRIARVKKYEPDTDTDTLTDTLTY